MATLWIQQLPLLNIKVLCSMTLCYLGIVYILSQIYMKNREKYSLIMITRIHNIILFIWSFIMFIGVLIGLLPFIINDGLFESIIVDKDIRVFKSIQFWYYMYYICKYYEMIDTVILVLKKKRIIFLHIFHHAIMPWSTYAAISQRWIPSVYALVWNNLIHIFMYYYYFISTFKTSSSISWKSYLTLMQIIQFIGGIFTALLYWYYCFDFGDNSIFEYDYLFGQTKCTGNSDPWICVFQTILISSFLLLFIIFYINAYFKKTKKQL